MIPLAVMLWFLLTRPAAPAVPAAEQSARVTAVADGPLVARLTARATSTVDMAPGRAPSSALPGGTVWLGTVIPADLDSTAAAFEWDVARGQVLPDSRRSLPINVDLHEGEPSAARIATAGDRIVLTTELARHSFVQLSLFEAQGPSILGTTRLPAGSRVSLEANERYIAVGYVAHHGLEGPFTYGVNVFKASDLSEVNRTTVAPLQGPSWTPRPDDIELFAGRLYVAVANAQGTRISAFELPSLQLVGVYDRARRGSGTDHQLSSRRGSLYLLDGGVLVELTPDLRVTSERAVGSTELALGPNDDILSPSGLRDGTGRRGDLVPQLGVPASCTPGWAGATPLLACAVAAPRGEVGDPGGASIVRLDALL